MLRDVRRIVSQQDRENVIHHSLCALSWKQASVIEKYGTYLMKQASLSQASHSKSVVKPGEKHGCLGPCLACQLNHSHPLTRDPPTNVAMQQWFVKEDAFKNLTSTLAHALG